MTLAGQLDIFTPLLLHQLLIKIPAGFCQVNPKANLHFKGFHGLEKHSGTESVGRRYLVIKPLVQRGFESQEPASYKPFRLPWAVKPPWWWPPRASTTHSLQMLLSCRSESSNK